MAQNLTNPMRCISCKTWMEDGGLCPSCGLNCGRTKQAPRGFAPRNRKRVYKTSQYVLAASIFAWVIVIAVAIVVL